MKGSCTNLRISDGEPVRGCGMEAWSETPYRTKVNPCAGRVTWVSMPRVAKPNIQPKAPGTGGGDGVKKQRLTPGDLCTSAESGSPVHEVRAKRAEKSDHPIVALKAGNAAGAKGVTT